MIDALLVVAAVAVTVGILLGLITLTVHLRVDTERQLRNTWRNEDIEEYVNYSISKGNSFESILMQVQNMFKLSDYESENTVWRIWCESGANARDYEYEAYGPNNYEDDGDALASAGFGTDEDYGGDIERF